MRLVRLFFPLTASVLSGCAGVLTCSIEGCPQQRTLAQNQASLQQKLQAADDARKASLIRQYGLAHYQKWELITDAYSKCVSDYQRNRAPSASDLRVRPVPGSFFDSTEKQLEAAQMPQQIAELEAACGRLPPTIDSTAYDG